MTYHNGSSTKQTLWNHLPDLDLNGMNPQLSKHFHKEFLSKLQKEKLEIER